MLKIVLDGAPSLREASKEVELPLSAKDQETMKEMLDYLIKSQDPEFLKKHPNVRSGVGLKERGFGAIVLQHEIDHLDGILFYDRIDKKDPFKELPGAVAI